MTFGGAGAGDGANAVFTGVLAEVELSVGSCDGRTTAGAGGFATRLGEPEGVTGFTGAMTGLIVPAGLAGAVCGMNAGFIFDPIAGVPPAGCTTDFDADCAGGLAAGLVDGGVVREFVGEVVAGKAGD